MKSPTPHFATVLNAPMSACAARNNGKTYASTASLLAIIFVLGFVVGAPLFTASTAPLAPAPAVGTIQVRASAQLTANTTQTFRLTTQVFTGSTNCSSGAGLETTVSGVNQATGYSINVAAGNSVLFTAAPLSEQSNETLPVPSIDLSGRFVNWFATSSEGITTPPSPDGRQICVAGFEGTETRELRAAYAPTLQLYDSTCTIQRTGLNPIFNPGETMCIKIIGGLTDSALPMRYFVAGGSVNECTWVPGAGQSFNDFPVNADPQTFSFTIPSSDSEIPSHCISGNSTSLLGSWRTGIQDVSGIRAVKRFVVDDPPTELGVIRAKPRAQFTANTSQTFTMTTQVFSGSTDCSTGGGVETTVTGINNTTGHTLSLGPGNSVLFTSAPLSEQSNETLPIPSIDLSGRFINWAAFSSEGVTTPPDPDGRKICVAGFEGPGTRDVAATFAPTLQLFDSTCTIQKTGLNPVFNPGETMCIKIIGGLTDSAIPMRYFVAGGSVNECTFLPGAGQSFNDFPVHSDPQSFSFTVPASDADIPSHCSASPTTTVIGSWRTGVVGVSAEIRGVKRFMVQASTAAGSIRVKPRAQFTARTSQTFTMTTQLFSGSMDCSTGAGAENTVAGIDRATGYSINVGAGDSVLLTSAPVSDQSNETPIDLSGRFISWAIPFGQPTSGFTFPPTPDGRQICVAGFNGSFTREVEASFSPTLQLYDSTCTTQKTGSNPEFAPGEAICIKILGGLRDSAIPFRYFVAGGSVNECTFLPGAGQSFNDFPVTTDPYTFSFNVPASNADIPAYCSASPTTSIFGSWRTAVVGVSAEIRGVKRFMVVDPDPDGDGVINSADNCPVDFNADQSNNDGDSQGDACDADDDNDGVVDTSDNCPLTANPDQLDTDGDLSGNACDTDDDGDGVLDVSDNCALASNADQTDTDSDALGDSCDPDDDGDFVLDAVDNCPLVENTSQQDTDGDGTGDACDSLTYNFVGFFQPVDNLPTVNVISAGKAVQVSFSLGGDRGMNIFLPGYPVTQQMICGGGVNENTVEETDSNGNSLSYNGASDTYTYKWKTDKAWKGTCRQLILKLADGSTHVANFRFK